MDIKLLLNGKMLSEMLELFTNRDDLVCDTKSKYLKYYNAFVHFICRNPLSPEVSGEEDYETLIYRDAKLKEIDSIIDDYKSGLITQNKAEKPFKLQKKKLKALNSNEIEEIQGNINADIQKIIEDKNSNAIKNYTVKQCTTARNALMAAAATRVPRRTLELVNMTMREFQMGEFKVIAGETHFFVYVLEHKTNEDGVPALVVFNEKELKALQIYIDSIRPRFISSTDLNSKVFIKCAQNEKDCKISLSNATYILNSYKTMSGKKLSTRIARLSNTTEQRKTNPSTNDIEDYSRTLSHTTETSNRYYVATDLEESVINTIERQMKRRKQKTVSFNGQIFCIRYSKISKNVTREIGMGSKCYIDYIELCSMQIIMF